MKKHRLKNSSKRLAHYGALALAIAGVADANGQIIYTDINPDFAGHDTTATNLDLDNDGVDDFKFLQVFGPAVVIGTFQSHVGHSFLGSDGNGTSYRYAYALNNGDPISAGQSNWFPGANFGTLNYDACQGGNGPSHWCGVTDKYLGLRFQIAGNTHYGWARLDVSASGANWTLKDYAYNSVPGQVLNAGDGQPVGIEENPLLKVKIAAFNHSITLYNLPESTDYRLYSVAGKSVLEGKVSGNTHVIDANALANGVYIIELKDNDTNSIIRKKLVL
jgi:hypothetical protein